MTVPTEKTTHNWFELAFYRIVISRMMYALNEYQQYLNNSREGKETIDVNAEINRTSIFMMELDQIAEINDINKFMEYMQKLVPDITNLDEANAHKMAYIVLGKELEARGFEGTISDPADKAQMFLKLLDSALGKLGGMPGVKVMAGGAGMPMREIGGENGNSWEGIMKSLEDGNAIVHDMNNCEECPEKDNCPDYKAEDGLDRANQSLEDLDENTATPN